MFRKIVVLFLFTFTASFASIAQVNITDSTIFTPIIYATYSYQWPSGGLAERFGSNSSIGGGVMFKTRSNWVFGLEGNFMFGQDVKNSDSMLKSISTSNGYVIDANGYYAEIVFYERGYNFIAKFGKVIPVLSPNPNCGLLITAGGGYIQDKIRIHNQGNTAPQLLDDYKKGYDKLNGGIVLQGTLGYMYLSNTRLLNFFIGFEFMQAWTKSYRQYDFDTRQKDTRAYSTQFYGVKVKWMIPLYRRTPKEYYYY
jgi:hypothetical protein